jgi:hypothetical protein
MFQPKIGAKYSQQQNPDDPAGAYANDVSKPITPQDLAGILHAKNSYAIYYVYKNASGEDSEKRVTTKPIYISKAHIEQLTAKVAADVEAKFPQLDKQKKKLKVAVAMRTTLEKLAVATAIQSSPEVKAAIDSGVPAKKLKATAWTTGAQKVNTPMIHKSSVPIVDDRTGEVIYDLDNLAAAITKRPAVLLKANEKMTKSMATGQDITMANIGIPAIKGLVVNEKTKEFRVITTCPGAGDCKAFCYVGSGNYIRYSASSENMMAALNYLYNDPNGFKQQIIGELKSLCKQGVKVYLRWHDSGDFFSKEYLHLAFDVAKAVPEATIYAYTKSAHVVNDPAMPNNFVINFSQGAKPTETKQVNLKSVKYSQVVPANLFKDEKTTGVGLARLQARDPDAQNRMKEILAKSYNLDPKTILTYDEMMAMPELPGNKHKFNVIIVPSLDGDLAAARRDVLGSYLLYH